MFSIVIPLYNKEKHIKNTLYSVLNQNYQSFEIIIVDDGSTDDSAEVVKSIKDERIKLIFQINQGVSSARNNGIKNAKYKYIAFLDADDFWYPNHLEELKNLIDIYPNNGFYSTSYEIQRDGKTLVPDNGLGGDFFGEVDGFFNSFSKGLSLVCSSTACVHKDLLKNIDGFPVFAKKGEDVYAWIRLALIAKLAHSDSVTAVYYQDAENRNNTSLSGEIPYYVLWLDQIINDQKVGKKIQQEAKHFLKNAIFFSAAGFKLDGNQLALENLQKLQIIKEFDLWLKLRVLTLVPNRILEFLKRFRHKSK